MKWIIGIELRHRSTAAVQFARWLSDATGAGWGEDFVGVHVLDADHLAAVLRTQHLDEVMQEARTASEEEVMRASPTDDRPVVDVVQALTIADGLEAARAAHGADGIILARVARRESHHVLRLGDVGRRLLRRLASPIIVVPPAFTADSAGDGPVVALTSLADDSIQACRFAGVVATSAARELATAYVTDDATDDTALVRWLDEHEVWPDLSAILHGAVAEAGLAFAEARGAPLIAMGAEPLKGVRRVLGPRLASRMAAVSEVPLLVVPQHWTAAARTHARTEPADAREGSDVGADTR
jgi:nucleotide-binding universal stress UspA family protein